MAKRKSTIQSIRFTSVDKERTARFYKRINDMVNSKEFTRYSVDQAVCKVFERCIEICKSAKSNWSIKDPQEMAAFCAKLISNEYQKKGRTPRFPRELINELKAKKVLK